MPTLSSSTRWAASAALLTTLLGGAAALAPAAQAAPTPSSLTAAPSPDTVTTAPATGAVTVQEAARSTGVSFRNSTQQQLQRTDSGLSHGCWSRDGLPQDAIAKTVTASWKSESCGFATGTEGYTVYRFASDWNQTVTLRWNNPYSGRNSYSCDAPAGYQCSWSGGSGNNANVAFTLTGGPSAFSAKTASDSDLTAAVTPVRSVKVNVNNYSGALLGRIGAGLDGGIWTGNSLPPSAINNGDRARWQSESEGFATGTAGSAEYLLSGGGKVTFRWSNPFAGSNSYSCEVPSGHNCTTSGGGGKNAEVTFTVN
ncbi:Crystal protein ET79 [Kitasatospora sp. NPDC094019]|uniref:Crystal protein ET79 n=1 Tax=Kitasatospora sp. NPDC094019 TaxID=3364091 RepID=UPI0038061385